MSVSEMTALGLVAGLHAALYGAYKDSPHESFLVRRFVRELVIAAAIGAVLGALDRGTHETRFVVYLSIFALSRIATECWKLFIRVEPQEGFRIPTQVHCVTGVVHNPAIRLLLGAGFVAGIYGCYALFTLLPDSLPVPLRGLIVGYGIGQAEALMGAYKDGTIEGFSWLKFAKSPTFGAIGGVIVSGHAHHLGFLLLATIGSMRMFLELLFKIVRPDYTPGKFRSMTGPFAEWMTLRRHFMPPYAATWMVYVILCSRPDW